MQRGWQQYNSGMSGTGNNDFDSPAEPDRAACPMCGAIIAFNARRCLSCGEKVTAPGSPPRPRFLLRPIEWVTILAIIAVTVALLLPAVQQASSGGPRDRCKENFKQIGLALYLYHEKYGAFPPAYIADESGRPMHSWRVLILPFLGEQQLYDEYRFDEPWNGPNNSRLKDRIVPRYNCRGDMKGPRLPATSMTSYVAIVGPETAWPGEKSTTRADFTDPTAETLFVVETTNSNIRWSEPRDLLAAQIAPVINSKSAPGLSSVHLGGAQVLFADGHVEFLPEKLPAATVRAMLTRAGGDQAGERRPAVKR